MKAKDMKPCAVCGKGVMHNGIPLFYRVTIERVGIDGRAVQQTHAMEQFFGGNVGVARAFMDPDIGKPIGDPETALVCQDCAMEPRPLALLAGPTP